MASRNLKIEMYGQFNVLRKNIVVQLNLVVIVFAIIVMSPVVVIIASLPSAFRRFN
jgi:hypothetical protein